ncbi:MAG: chalcone isomerase family protein, partial [Desulfovermiculus sp.]
LTAGDVQLQLNGAGVRNKFFLNLYVGVLYLEVPSDKGREVVSADEPMAIRLHVLSKLITSKRMEEASREGFVQATNGDIAPIQERIEEFISLFKYEEIVKGDVFDFVYRPEKGIQAYKNEELMSTVKGLDFKKALFAIWLGHDPIQESLKAKMLGAG